MFAFIHVPKCGGTSISWALEQRHKLLRLNGWDEIRRFIETEDWRNGWTASTGHMPFGIDAYYPETRYVIMLREPMDRLMSSYYYSRRRTDHELHKTATDVPLRDFPGGNSMTRRLAAWRWTEIFDRPDFWWQKYPLGYCTDDMLEEAKANLRRCEFVGLYDAYEADAARILSMAGIEAPSVPRMNVTEGRPPVSDIDAETLAILREKNSFDFELYAYAQSLRHGRQAVSACSTASGSFVGQ